MKGRLIDLTIGLDGVQRVTVAVLGDFRQQYDALKDVAVDVEIKKHRELRSKDANAYCWLLISKIAEAIQPPLSKDEVYVKMLKRYGQGATAKIRNSEVSNFCRAFKYHEKLDRLVEDGVTYFRFWVGSHEYDTKEMSLFIDGIVQEAKDLGIDTDTPEQIERFKSMWGG